MNALNVDLYFYHIEKCAGSSMRKIIYDEAKKKYSDEQIHIPGCNRPFQQNIGVFSSNNPDALEYFSKIKVIADHSNPGELKEILQIPVDVKFSITALRRPIPRIISHYHFFDKPTMKYESLEQMPEEILAAYLKRIQNIQTRRLANGKRSLNMARVTLQKLNAVIITEEFEKSLRLISKLNPFGFNFNQPVQINTTEEKRKESYKDLYSQHFLEKLKQNYAKLDDEIYSVGLKKFREACSGNNVL